MSEKKFELGMPSDFEKFYRNPVEDYTKMPIPFFRPDKSIPAPFSKDPLGNAGWDLYTTEEHWIQPGEIIKIPVNLQAAIPPGYYGHVTPRSGLSSEGINIISGTIDSNYRGQIHAITQNFSHEVFHIKRGMRVAQLIVVKHEFIEWQEVENEEDLGATLRGKEGFGESGVF